MLFGPALAAAAREEAFLSISIEPLKSAPSARTKMPSRYAKWCRSDPYDASMRNLRKAFESERYHPQRPWRSPEEMLMVRRLALWWWTCRDNNKPSGRAWAREKLGISHVWLLKLVRKFETDPVEVRRLQAYGDPTPEQLRRTKEYTQRMRERGKLRLQSSRRRVPPAMEQFVRERFAQGWSRSRLARGFDLDRRTVKRILQKV